MWRNTCVRVLLCLVAGIQGQVIAASPVDRDAAVSVYWAKWANTRLLQVPGKASTGTMDYFEPEFLALGVHYPLTHNPGLLRWVGVGSVELETLLVKHTEVQSHWESDVALVLRSRPIIDLPVLGMNFAAGNGFSYAYTPPTFEKGGNGVQNEGTRQFQYYMNFEFEFYHPDYPVSFGPRLHHRSGIYGLVSPRRTGSNYLGVGLRYSLP